MCKRLKRLKDTIFEHLCYLHDDETLFSQFLLTYGVMTCILLILIAFQAFTSKEGVTTAKIWSLIVNAYSPTTITFIASLMFEHSCIKNDKRKSAWFLFFVIIMALTYVAFEAINAQTENDTASAVLGFVGLLFPVMSLCTLFGSLDGTNTTGIEKHATADGSVSGKKGN